MNRIKLLSVAILLVAIAFTSCKKDKPQTPEDNKDYNYEGILTTYVDKTIIPTYADMKDNAKLLAIKTKSFQTLGSQSDLDAACEYWKKTRKPWEAGESFLFGPAAYHNLDPLLDSWPLDQAQLQQVLDGSAELTADYVRDGLGAVLRGFHTVEFLLFRNGQNRQAGDFTQREKEYLSAVSEVLRDDCVKLWAAWEGGTGEEAILEAIDFEVAVPFGDEIKKAGKVGSRYISQTDAIDEMLQGSMGIADEVANGKIADPHTSGNVLDVESWFSWNSLTDFQNNIRSIQNSYLGGYKADNRGKSLSDFIKVKDAALDTEVKQKISDAIAAIAAIPEPFRNHLTDPAVTTAMAKVNEVQNIISKKVRPIVIK